MRRKFPNRGFTLVEVTVAMALLSIAGLGAISLMRTSFEINANSRKKTIAADWAKQTLDGLFGATALAPGSSEFDLVLNASDAVGTAASCAACTIAGCPPCSSTSATNPGITRNVTLAGPDANDLQVLTVRMTWESVQGSHHIDFISALSRPQ